MPNLQRSQPPGRHAEDDHDDADFVRSPKMPTRKQQDLESVAADTAGAASNDDRRSHLPTKQSVKIPAVGAFKHFYHNTAEEEHDNKSQITSNKVPSDVEIKRQAKQYLPSPIPLQNSGAGSSIRSSKSCTRGPDFISDGDRDMMPPSRRESKGDAKVKKQGVMEEQQEKSENEPQLRHFDVVDRVPTTPSAASSSSTSSNNEGGEAEPENRVGAHPVRGPGHNRLALTPVRAPSTTSINEIQNTADAEHGSWQQNPSGAASGENGQEEVLPLAELVPYEQDLDTRVQQQVREIYGRGVVSVEADTTTQDDTKKRLIIVGGIAIVLLGAIGVAVAFVLGRGPSPDAVPCFSPISTNVSSYHPQYEFVSKQLFAISGNAICEEGTSQFKAFQWLVHEDPVMLPFSQMAPRVLRERYALAVFYFSLQGENWTQPSNFLSANPVCDWNVNSTFGVQCDGTAVSELILYRNNLVGSIPSELIILASLKTIRLGDNGIFGTIPPKIGDLNILETLNLVLNKISGSISPFIFLIPKIKTVNLSYNNLIGSIPETITEAENLENLFCFMCGLNGTIPQDLSKLQNISIFQFNYNSLSGPIPAGLTALPKLQYIGLSFNRLTGSVPEFKNQTSLQQISIEDNYLSGLFPSSVGLLPNLLYLYAEENTFSGTIPLFDANNNTLQEIFLEGCGLAGNFTQFVLSLPKTLRSLQVQENQLTGTIPTEIGLFSEMIGFSSSENKHGGTLPTELGSLSSLSILGFNRVELSGAIPSEIGYLTDLEILSLSNNQITGGIPSEIGNLEKLEYLFLASNPFLGGTVPTSFQNLGNLRAVYLHGTMLTGNLNSIFCLDDGTTWIPDLQADCAGSELICDCCSYCYKTL